MSNPGTAAPAGATSYQATQAQTQGFFDTIITDIEDPVNHPMVFVVGGLMLAGILFLGSSKPKKKKKGGRTAHADIQIF